MAIAAPTMATAASTGCSGAPSNATLFQNRDYPVLTDYRALFAGLFARAYGLDQKLIAQVFPGVAAKDLALV
jgi:uncharacterized protein (DUF1501 family)